MTSAASPRTLRTAVQIVLQDNGCGRSVEPRLAGSPVFVANGKAALGFAARQALVLQRDRKVSPGTEFPREPFYPRRHVAGRPVQPPRQAHHDRGDSIFLASE